jgi:hypothetical protein
MPEFLADPGQGLYLGLGLLVVITLILWSRSRKRSGLIAVGVAVAMLLIVILCDSLAESPREQIERKTIALAAAVTSKNTDQLTANVADSFRYSGVDKANVKAAADKAVKQFGLQEIQVWEFTRTPVRRDDQTYVQRFKLKPKGAFTMGVEHFDCEATWVKEADGQYRLKSFELFHPLTGEKFVVPGI